MRLKFNEETQLALSGTADFESDPPGRYLQLKLTRKLTDAFHVEGGFDLIDGPTHTVGGQWRHNDRAFLTSSSPMSTTPSPPRAGARRRCCERKGLAREILDSR